MRAEDVVEPQVRAFGDQVRIEVAEERPEAVRILDVGLEAAREHAQPVRERRAGPDLAGEETGRIDALQRRARRARLGIDDGDPLRPRQERAHDDLAVFDVHAQHGERVAVPGLDDGEHVGIVGCRDHAVAFRPGSLRPAGRRGGVSAALRTPRSAGSASQRARSNRFDGTRRPFARFAVEVFVKQDLDRASADRVGRPVARRRTAARRRRLREDLDQAARDLCATSQSVSIVPEPVGNSTLYSSP